MPTQYYKGDPALSRAIAPTKVALVRHQDQAIEISADGTNPLPDHIILGLTERMAYQHVKMLFNKGRFGPDGKQSRVETEERELFEMLPNGAIFTGSGYLPFVWDYLEARGYKIDYADLSRKPSHPKAYELDWEHLYEVFKPRPRQEDCLATIASCEGGIIDAIPGFGKSAVIGAACRAFRHANHAVITKRVEIVRGLVDEISRYVGVVGQVGGGESFKSRVTVYSADSAHHLDDIQDKVDFLWCDEAHELVADKYADLIARMEIRRRYGFTATPEGRADNAHARLEWLFGPTIFKLAWQEGVKLGLVVPIEVYWHDVDIPHPCPGKEATTKKRWGLWRNRERNQIIADVARQYPDDDQVLILVEKVEHALFLRKLLPEFEVVHGNLDENDEFFYKNNKLIADDWQPLTQKRRIQLRDAFRSGKQKKFIATGVWEVGVSFDSLAVLIRAGGGSSEIAATQAPGRVSRIHSPSGKDVGIVHDFVDQFDKGFQRNGLDRRRHYRKHGWEQHDPPRAQNSRQLSQALYR